MFFAWNLTDAAVSIIRAFFNDEVSDENFTSI